MYIASYGAHMIKYYRKDDINARLNAKIFCLYARQIRYG